MTTDPATPAPAAGSPAVSRRRLAAELRQRREQAGLTIDEAAGKLEWSSAKISRIENAKVTILPRDVKYLLGIYGQPDDDERERLLALSRESRLKGWWQSYDITVPDWLQPYAALEAEAALLRSYHPELIPPLLRTPAYRHAIRDSPADLDSDQLAPLLHARQQHRADTGTPHLHAILSEAVIRRTAGTPALMAAQLTHLTDATRQPGTTIQVLPFHAGTHPAMDTPFTLLTFPDPADPATAYAGPHHGTPAQNHAVQHYQHAFTRLQHIALSPHDSRTLITQAADELARRAGTGRPARHAPAATCTGTGTPEPA